MTHDEYTELHRLVDGMDIDADPKDIRRDMLTPEEKALCAFLTPSRIRSMLRHIEEY